jgi:hypothetical protein
MILADLKIFFLKVWPTSKCYFQAVERVSFCAPTSVSERGFCYICRDGLTQRWMCYAFNAKKDKVRAHFE